jgi:hypothetical protein
MPDSLSVGARLAAIGLIAFSQCGENRKQHNPMPDRSPPNMQRGPAEVSTDRLPIRRDGHAGNSTLAFLLRCNIFVATQNR